MPTTKPVLITGGRAPVTVDLVRALAQAGQTVFVADSLPRPSLASRSRFCAGSLQLPPPRQQFPAFAQALRAAVTRLGVGMVLPTCEEVFYLAQLDLPPPTFGFFPPFATLARWHHKGHFQQIAAAAGLLTPPTIVVKHPHELAQALTCFPRYLLKPAYSRFGARVQSNVGPLAQQRSHPPVQPHPSDPWLVQAFINGTMLCSYSLVHKGHVTAHCAYLPLATAGPGAGTAFVSVDGRASLAAVQALLDPQISGQISLDFIVTPNGRLVVLECNPRATSGVHLLDPARLAGGLLNPQQPTWLEPAGRRRQLSLAALPTLAATALRRPWHADAWRALATGLRTPDVLFRSDDPRPALAQVPQALHFVGVARRQGLGVLAATTADLEWNGDAPTWA